MKKIYLLPLMLLFQAIFAMEKDITPETSTLAMSTILQNNPTLTREKIATFLHIKKILSITESISKDLKQKHGSYLGTSHHIQPNPHCGRTKEGLVLFCNTYPMFLGTPWGVIKIYGGACFYDGTEHLPTYTLFQRLGVNFVQCTSANQDVYEVLPPTFDETKKRFTTFQSKLTHKELSAAVGSSKIILPTSDEQFSIYTIKTVDTELCPEATNLNSNGRSSDIQDIKNIQNEWTALENLATKGLLR